ncbi:hypothetical protein [Rickettsia conorii]|uniref:Acyl-[acyl-carrier-protein]--UDP-N-acetylglucosamine O-acyltransferase n=2 Tax=Rickettsia conorii subsp. raoultii TaxID=369822 RepID=A0ABY4TXX3_RICCR|nr:hypothetical protein NBT09_04050 [Rickettsia conorii subsp. raoultii]
MAVFDLPDHQEFISLQWLKLEQFKFNQSGTNMSDQNTKTISRPVIEFTLNENKKNLRAEIADLLERPITKSDIERIEQRLAELEKIFSNDL